MISSPELYRIYYIFVFSTVGRLLIPFLRRLGLNCTEPQYNRVQGIVSTLIFFDNIYLELFWLDENSHLAQSDLTTEFNFLARFNWLETGASPFGFALFYQTDNGNFLTSTVEAQGRDEVQISDELLRFLPSNLANPDEPICYFVPDYVATNNRLNRILTTTEQILAQTSGMSQLTHVKLRVSSDRLFTSPLASLSSQNFLDIEYRKYPLLELTFDDGNQQRCLDLRPLIPIILRY